MADPTIIQIAKTYFTSDFYKIAATRLGERKYEVEMAISAIIPLILGALLNRATSGKENCESVYNVCLEEAEKFSVNFDFSKLVADNAPSSLYLLKEKKGIIEKEIALYADIKLASVSKLISMVVPSILGLTGKHATRNNLSANGLAGFLSSQESFIIPHIPEPLHSFEKYFDLAPTKKSNFLHWDYSFKKFSSSHPAKKWWIISAVVLALAIIVYFLATK